MRELLIFGAGGHGKVLLDTARAAGWRVVAVADGAEERRGDTLLRSSINVIGVEEAVGCCRERGALAVVAVGDNRRRAVLFASFVVAGVEMASVVHPGAQVSAHAKIGAGAVIYAGAIVQTGACVGDDVILNTASSVDHDGVVEAHAHVGPGAHLGGCARIGPGAHLGLGALIRDGVSVGEWSVVGMGAVVVADVPDHVVAYGCPASVVGPNPAQVQAA